MKTLLTKIAVTLAVFSASSVAQAGQTPQAPPASSDTWYGYQSFFGAPSGTDNSAFGYQALHGNTSGSGNSGIGSQALFSNTSGNNNTSTGFQSLLFNTTGTSNTATGHWALYSNESGGANTAYGDDALRQNMSGTANTAIGTGSLFDCGGYNNIGLGYNAGEHLTFGNNNIDIGNGGVAGDANTIRIGTQTFTPPDFPAHTDTYIGGIFGSSTLTPGMPVFVDANGKLGTAPSSTRFKKDVAPMRGASEVIYTLQPVTFRYKPEVMKDAAPQFGLIAEEVAKASADLVVRDAKGQVHSVRYEAVNAMLLNEFIKEHRQVQEQQRQINKLATELNEQASTLQKVSAQVELMKAAPKTVADGR